MAKATFSKTYTTSAPKVVSGGGTKGAKNVNTGTSSSRTLANSLQETHWKNRQGQNPTKY